MNWFKQDWFAGNWFAQNWFRGSGAKTGGGSGLEADSWKPSVYRLDFAGMRQEDEAILLVAVAFLEQDPYDWT